MITTRISNNNAELTPSWIIAVGGIFIVIGLGIASGYYFSYKDWPEVEYEVKDLNCYKGTYCTIEYKYTYNGQDYSVIDYNVPSSVGRASSFYLNPNDPNEHRHHYELEEGYTVAVTCLSLGFIVALFGALFGALKKKWNAGDDKK